uniref:Uncharacterized protein n=1 Tax=Triticum urartu TaxID=4572 RepID=A0A8R7TDN6_TRIUA
MGRPHPPSSSHTAATLIFPSIPRVFSPLALALPRRSNGRRRRSRREILPPIRIRHLLPPRRGRQGRLPLRAGGPLEAAPLLPSPRPPRPKVAAGDEQRLLGVADAHAQRHGLGAHDVAPRRPGSRRFLLDLRRSLRSVRMEVTDEDACYFFTNRISFALSNAHG